MCEDCADLCEPSEMQSMYRFDAAELSAGFLAEFGAPRCWVAGGYPSMFLISDEDVGKL
jgi:hypothetical protein